MTPSQHKFATGSLGFLIMLLVFALSACKLQTEEPAVPILKPATHLVINEVFTLPSTNQRAYSWIEFYNPTGDTINLAGWTFSFSTSGSISTFAMQDSQVIIGSFRVRQSGEGTYALPFLNQQFQSPVLKGGEFLTITNNEQRLLTYTDYGQGKGTRLAFPEFINATLAFVITPDTAVADTFLSFAVDFRLRTTDQITLRNQRGEIVDVVRYGNYTYNGTGPDPFPNNRSIGAIPEYQSIARFNGAYFTGNTTDDFYITAQKSLTRPIPHWHSQVYKQ
jgi:hypothetical protein